MKTILIDTASGLTPEQAIAALNNSSLDDRAIWILHLEKKDNKKSASSPQSYQEARLSDNLTVHFSMSNSRRYLVMEASGERLSEIGGVVRKRMNENFSHLCIFANAGDFADILTQLEHSIYAMSPQIAKSNTDASYQYFCQLFEKMVKPYPEMQNTGRGDNPYGAIWENITERRPNDTHVDRRASAGGNAPLIETLTADTIIYTRIDNFFQDAIDFGLKFVAERVRMEGQLVFLNADDEEAIAVYGPDLKLDSGQFEVVFTIDTANDHTFGETMDSDLVLRVDVVLAGGAHCVQDIPFVLPINGGVQDLEVPFKISEEFASSTGVETRLWIVRGKGQFKICSYFLRKIPGQTMEDEQ